MATLVQLIEHLQSHLKAGVPPNTEVVVYDPLTQLYLAVRSTEYVSPRETTTVPRLKLVCDESGVGTGGA